MAYSAAGWKYHRTANLARDSTSNPWARDRRMTSVSAPRIESNSITWYADEYARFSDSNCLAVAGKSDRFRNSSTTSDLSGSQAPIPPISHGWANTAAVIIASRGSVGMW